MKNKKNLVVHINNLSPEILEELIKKHPDGYMNHVIKVPRKNNDFFYAVTLDTKDASYLIKVDVKVDNISDEKLSEQLFIKDDIPDIDLKETDDEDDLDTTTKPEDTNEEF